MHVADLAQFFLFILLLVGLTPILGSYIAKIFMGEQTFLHPLLEKSEILSYRLFGINPAKEMSWIEYGKSLLILNILGFGSLFALQLIQGWLPLNPQHFPGVPWPLALNTAISFTTNTNWQAYPGETTLSYLTQMWGLTTQNFLSAATGMGTLLALVRGMTRQNSETIGNFWVDLVRTLLYLLLPLSILMAVVLVSEGSVQSLSPYPEVTTLEGAKQTIAIGPAASQIAIKQLGTNGGGFFNANSAHPFENPSAVSNLLEMLALLLIPAGSVYAYGVMVGSKKHGWLLFGVMLTLLVGGMVLAFYSESIKNPLLQAYPVWEGKEVRLGNANSLLWSASTTASANGSVNAMLSSLSPLAGGIALFNIMLGELVFGGVGVGLCSMLMFVILTVFLSGLMVGRTPEYRGKKIEKSEIKWVILAILLPAALILIGAGISCILPEALSGLGNQGPHGLSEILYAFTSCAGNNGSAFAGLNANTDYYNLALGCVMGLARVGIILPSLAIAGLLTKKKAVPPSNGTFSTDSMLFAGLLLAVILIVGALTFFPALSLGPILEQLLMLEGRSF